MENLKCRNCGSHFQDRRSQKKCEKCKGVKLFDLIPLQTKGLICELYANGYTMKAISEEFKLSYDLVQKVVSAYLGVNEQPILMIIKND